jgi:putative PEP-CTERM system TPR-repeat lipoprotein
MRIALLVLVSFGLAACGGDNANDLPGSDAYNSIAQAEYLAAETRWKNAIAQGTELPNAHYQLGRVYLDKNQNEAAEQEFLLAQELGWRAEDIRPALAEALLAQGRGSEVINMEHQGLNDSGASKLLAVQAVAASLEGQFKEAGEFLALARAKNPESTETDVAEAMVLDLEGYTAYSGALVDEVLENHPENVQALRLKGHLLLRQQKLPEARMAFGQSIAHADIAYANYLNRAYISLQLKDVAAAEADAKELEAITPGSPGSLYIQGLLQFNEKQYRNTITFLSKIEHAAPRYPPLLFYLGLSHMFVGNPDIAAKLLHQYVDLVQEDIQARKLLALLWLQAQKPGEARDVLQPALEYNPDDVGALNIMGNALLRDGQADQGLALFMHITQLSPDLPVRDMPLTMGLLSSGLGSEAGGRVEALLDKRPEFPRTEILEILEHLQRKDFSGAIQAADLYKWRNPGEINALNVLGGVYMEAGQLVQALETFEKALKLDPGNPSANLNLARMMRDVEDLAAERQHYNAVLKQQPNHLRTLLRLADLEARENNIADKEAVLKQARDSHWNALEPRLELARHYIDSGSPQRVTPLFSGLNPLQRRSPRALELIAYAQLETGEHTQAYITLEQIFAEDPQGLRDETARAIAILEKLVQSPGQKFPQRSRARKLLHARKYWIREDQKDTMQL